MSARGPVALLAAGALASGAVAGCGVVPAPPAQDPAWGAASASPGASPPFPTASPSEPALEAGFAAAQRVAVRVRNVGCGLGVSTGSGFAVDAHTLVTNEHVVEGAATLQVDTFDGHELEVTTAGISVVADLALIRTIEPMDAIVALAATDAAVGDEVTVVGFPGGGPMTTSTGRVLAYQEDPLGTNVDQVMAMDATVAPGSSGSPVFGADGSVVGVVYAVSSTGTASFAVPVSALAQLLEDADEAEATDC